MQPIKISIQGDYIDTQIYMGRLYLWTLDGAVLTVDWNKLVNSIIKKKIDKPVLEFCFKNGRSLYKPDVISIFEDPEFSKLLIRKFKRIAKNEIVINAKNLKKFIIGEQNTPTNIIPTDTEIYGKKLYFITEKGLYSGSVHRNKNEKYLVSSRPSKLWDCNLLTLKANKYPQIALSAGNDGLFELDLSSNIEFRKKSIENHSKIYQISTEHSSFSNYSFLSIYSSSYIKNSFMALFKWEKSEKEPTSIFDMRRSLYYRISDKIIDEKTIFKNPDNIDRLSWGSDDKIYRAAKNGVEIIRFNNYAKKENNEEFFENEKFIKTSFKNGEVIGGGVSIFGTIIETENSLILSLSNNETFEIEGPITKWRVFPRSLNYENQLHVILDDRIEIYSFNHDYFLDQNEKNFGIKYEPEYKATYGNKGYT